MRKIFFILTFLICSICTFGQECAQTDIQQAYIAFSTNAEIVISEAIYSVQDSVKVKFALGNLMYRPSTGEWKLADRQYDFVGGQFYGTTEGSDKCTPELHEGDFYGCVYVDGVRSRNTDMDKTGGANGHTYCNPRWTGNYEGWIDLFHFDSTAIDSAKSLRLINNRDSIIYRTPTEGEFAYLIGGKIKGTNRYIPSRPNAAALRGRGRILLDNGDFVNGLILLPDSCPGMPLDSCILRYIPSGKTFKSDTIGTNSYCDNVFTEAEWRFIEGQGALFLPAAGSGKKNSNNKYNRSGYYWTSTDNGTKATSFEFGGYEFSDGYSYYGGNPNVTKNEEFRAIRLCYDVK